MASDLTLYDSTGNPVIVTGDEMKEFISYPPPIGVGQTWQDVMADRELDVEYTNDTGRPIMISVSCVATADPFIVSPSLYVNGLEISASVIRENNGSQYSTVQGIIPSGSSYRCINGNGVLYLWVELRGV